MVRKVYTTKESFTEQNEALGTALPWEEELSVFRQSLKVGTKEIPNRLACQAMEGCDGTPGGSPDELTVRRYDRFARGGAGTVWGPLIGTLGLHLLGEGAKHLLHNAPGLNFVLYAVVLICALRFLPQGLMGLAGRIGTFRKKEDDNA